MKKDKIVVNRETDLYAKNYKIKRQVDKEMDEISSRIGDLMSKYHKLVMGYSVNSIRGAMPKINIIFSGSAMMEVSDYIEENDSENPKMD